MPLPSPLIGVDWLAERLGDPSVAILDASWHLPSLARDARAEFEAAHIPGAVFFDIDAVADKSVLLPHMLPDAAEFAAAAGRLGVSDRQTIVVYDTLGLYSAARAWWTFEIFGARDVRILDGGFPAWLAAGRPIEKGPAQPAPGRFEADFSGASVRDFDAVGRELASGRSQVVDARAAERFRGEGGEPRPGVRPGHIPGSRNLPFGNLIEGGRLKSPEAIVRAFGDAGIDLDRPIVTSCGSGVTAAIVLLAARIAGASDVSLYDGSWVDWGSRSDAAIATGPEPGHAAQPATRNGRGTAPAI